MAKVQIDIPGVGLVTADNAASESTLQELVKVLSGKGSSGSTGGAGTAGSSGASLPTRQIKDFSDEIEGTSTFVEDLGGAAAGAARGLIKMTAGIIGGAIGAVTEFGMALATGSGKMGELGAAIPLIGGVLGPLGNALDDTVDNFRAAANVGASFGNDMFGVQRAAADAGMTLQGFSSLIAENSDRLAMLGGSVTEGATRFANVSKALRTGRLGDNLMNMGYSIEGINEGFLNYTEEMAKQGRLSGMTNAQLIAGSAEYMENLDELSKVTGKTREELAGMRNQALNDAKINRMANRLQGEERENFLNNISQLNAVSPGLRDIFVDLADGTAQTAEAQMLMASSAGQSAMALAQQMKNGELSEAEFNNRLRALGPELDQFFGGMSDAQLAALEETNPALYALATSAIGLNQLQEKSAEQIAAEQRQRRALTGLSTSFQQAFLDLKGKITTLFLDSPLFETLSSAFAQIVSPAEGAADMFETIKPKLEEFMNWINGWIQQFMADPIGTFEEIIENIKGYITDGIGNLFSSLLQAAIPTLVGGVVALLLAPITGPFLAIAAGIAAIFGTEWITGIMSEGWEALTGVFTGISDWWSNLSFSETIQGAWDSVTGIFSGIGDWWSNLSFGDMFQGAWDKVTGLFSGIGDWWSNMSFSETFNNAWNSLTSWFTDLFNFDFELPNFSDYLPKWMGGEGKSLSSLFGSDAPAEAEEVASSEAPEMEAVASAAQNLQPINNGQSMSGSDAEALNTTMQRMIALLEENNRLTRRTNTSISEIGTV